MVQTGLLEFVGRNDSDWAGDSATRQSVTGYHCHRDVQNATMCNRNLKQTAISFSSCEAEFYAANACARESLGLAELFKELHCKVSVVSNGFRLGKTHSAAQRTRLKHIETMLVNAAVDTRETSIRESSGHSSSLLQLVHRQTQLSCTMLIQTRARTWIEQALNSICLLVFAKQEQFTLSS